MSVFDPKAFLNPSNAHRPLQIVHGLDRSLTDPENLTGEEGIDRHLQKLADMGTGGIVTNVGFRDYLVSPRQWEILNYGLRKAAEQNFVLWWYDEKGYPSGTAGGIVTRAHPEYSAQGLACYRQEVEGPRAVRVDLPVSCRRFVWAGAMPDPDVATRATVVDLSDKIDEWGTLRWDAPAGKWTVLYLAERIMYEGTHASGNVCEFKHYVNLLKPEAVREFIRVTHEQYYREIPSDLWDKMVAVFTDEPSFMVTYTGKLPERFDGKIPVIDAPIFNDRPPAVPWVDDLLERFQAMKGYDLRPYLFSLFFSQEPEAQYVRQDYYDVITRLYTDAFYVQVLRWCQEHGIASSGHVMAEETLIAHVTYHGSLFSVIREMDLPGIDMLNSDPQDMLARHSFMAAKQVASVAHLTGAKQVHSESSDWVQGNEGRYATLPERLGQGNLQYVLGINQITSYFSWHELDDDAWKQYNDYMGRLASLLTGGQHVCDVAVLYPIRSIWTHYLPALEPPQGRSHGSKPRSEWVAKLNEEYPDVVRGLLRSQVDLDIVDEQALIEGEIRDGALYVADEAYRAIVLPPMYALSLDAARALARFCEAGGTLLSVGPLPEMAESAANTPALKEILAGLFGAGGPARILPLEGMPEALGASLGADLALAEGNADILYTHRRLEGRDLYFIINNNPAATRIAPTLRVPGPYTLYRPLDGTVSEAGASLDLELAGYEGVFVVCGA
jgi:hypothetical protein